MAVALQKTNVTIGLVGPYCAVPFVSTSDSLVTRYPKTFSRDTIDVFGWSGWAFLNDAVISMAISDINSRPDILLNLQVNIKRFSSCGPYNPTANLKYNGQPIGFASAIMTNDIINVHKDVIAVVGNDISSVAIPTAQILSNNQIPYCSIYAGSPALSDKRIFNYFWRTLIINIADAVPVFLKSLGVKQVAIVVQKYSSFLLTSQQFIRNVQKEEMRIVASAHIATIITNEQILYAATVMKRVSARYIVIFGDSGFVAEAMYKLGKLGFKGSSGIVWFAQNAPNPFYDPLKVLGPDYYRYATDYIFTGSYPLNWNVPPLLEFYNYLNITDSSTRDDVMLNTNFQAAYDCTMNMLYGINKLLEANKGLEPLLSLREAGPLMNYTLFQKTEYKGILNETFELTSDGSLKVPAVFRMHRRGHSFAFGEVNSNFTEFKFYHDAPPIFANGSYTPPHDGSTSDPDFFYYALDNWQGRWILVLGAIGIIGCCWGIGFYVRRKAYVHIISVPESATTIFGCLLCYLSIFATVGPISKLRCQLHQPLLMAGINIVLSALLCKNIVFLKLFSGVRVKNAAIMVRKFRLISLTIIVLNLALILVSKNNARVVVIQAAESKYYQTCRYPKTVIITLIYTLNILLLVSFVPVVLYVLRRVWWENEAALMMSTTASIVLCYFIIEEIEQSENINNTFSTVVCIWLTTTVNLLSFVFPKAIANYSNLINTWNKISIKALQEKKPRSRGVVRSQTMMVVSEPSVYQIRTINKTVDTCPYKFARGHKLVWSKWVLGKPEIHSVRNNVWLIFNSKNLINCFSFVRNGNIVTKGNLVVLSVRATLEGTRRNLNAGNYDLVMEFENFDMANSFVKEFQNALLKAGTISNKY